MLKYEGHTSIPVREIGKDVHRSFPEHPFYSTEVPFLPYLSVPFLLCSLVPLPSFLSSFIELFSRKESQRFKMSSLPFLGIILKFSFYPLLERERRRKGERLNEEEVVLTERK
jgi:hypothetical protein